MSRKIVEPKTSIAIVKKLCANVVERTVNQDVMTKNKKITLNKGR